MHLCIKQMSARLFFLLKDILWESIDWYEIWQINWQLNCSSITAKLNLI